MCRTELLSCCDDVDNVNGGFQGEWYGPDGNRVSSAMELDSPEGLYSSRDNGSISLNRRGNTTLPTGSFCCTIPNVVGQNETTCVILRGQFVSY